MNKKVIVVFRYVNSLSGLLILSGIVLLFFSGYIDWHNLIENFGLAFTASGITTFLFKFDLYKMITEDGMRDSGLEAIKHGRNAMLDHIGGIEVFLRKARPKEIDICGIAMYSFFEPHSVYDLLIQLSAEGYSIRIAFAHPESAELKLQEEAEHKPGSLKYHIEYLVDKISRHFDESKIGSKNGKLSVVYSKQLPKAFIIRSGNKILVTHYFLRGPHLSPTYYLSDVPGGIFYSFREYLDDVFKYSERIPDFSQSSKD